MNVSKNVWGSYDGQDIYLFKLRNEKMEIMLSNFGATITSITMPDKNG